MAIADQIPAVKGRPISALRWWIGGLLFASTVINYIDRQTLSVLAPYLKRDYRWSNEDFALVVIAFRIAFDIRLRALLDDSACFTFGLVQERVGRYSQRYERHGRRNRDDHFDLFDRLCFGPLLVRAILIAASLIPLAGMVLVLLLIRNKESIIVWRGAYEGRVE